MEILDDATALPTPSHLRETRFFYRSAAGADPPLKSSRPSASLMERPFPTGPPAFARKPVISTSVPALTVSVFQPSRINAFGAPSSKRQLVTVPLGSLTST